MDDVAVNSVYKLQFFLTFISAVLLPVLSRLLIMSINTTFFAYEFNTVTMRFGRQTSKFSMIV